MRKFLAAVALLCAGAVQAAIPQARDLNGDGTADAYYDPAQNLTWLATSSGSGRYNGWILPASILETETGIFPWRLPRLLDFTTPFESCELGAFYPGDYINSCRRAVSPNSSEVSRFASEGWNFGDIAIWSSSEINATDVRIPDQTFLLRPLLGRTSDLFIFDDSCPCGVFWFVIDGDHGTAIAQIPEPSAAILLASGLLLLKRRHIVVIARPARTWFPMFVPFPSRTDVRTDVGKHTPANAGVTQGASRIASTG